MVTQRPALEREPLPHRIEVGADRGMRETLVEGCRAVWTRTRDLLAGARDALSGTDRAVAESVDRGPEEPRFEFTQPVRIALPDGKIETWMVVGVPTERGGKYELMPFARRATDVRRMVSEAELRKLNKAVPSPNPERSRTRNPFYDGEEVYLLLTLGNGVAEKGWYVRHDDATDQWFVEREDHSQVRGRHVSTKRRASFQPDRVAHIYEVEENGTRLSLPDEPNFLLHKRAVEFGKKGNLSRSMVKMLFEGEIQQQNVDNCYLLAAFYSLRQCPHFEVLMSRAIRKQKNGWIVRFPFGSEKAGKEIPVSDAELSLAQPVAKQGGGTDMLMPVKGNVGWRLLEAAYTKLVTGSMNRKATSWGNASPALREIFGKAVDPAFDASLKPEKPISDDAKLKEKVLLYLRNFHPGKDIATCSSLIPPVLPGGKISYTKQSFTGPVELFPRHAYSVESVDRIHRMVTVKNPHDTSRPLIFTFDQFCDAFREVDHVELSRENLFSENEMPAIGYRTNNPKIKPSPQPTPPKRRGGPPPPPPPRSLKSRSVGRKSTDSVLTN